MSPNICAQVANFGVTQQKMEFGTRVNWETIGASRGVQKIPVCLTIACKVVTEDEQGGLSLDASTMQSVLLDGAPADGGSQLLAQLPVFPIKAKGPGGDLLRGGDSLPSWETVETGGQRSLQMVSLKLFLKDGQLDVRQHSHS